VEEYLQPLVCAIPMQRLAYYVAILRGCNVDCPRNLAKSVTVELQRPAVFLEKKPPGCRGVRNSEVSSKYTAIARCFEKQQAFSKAEARRITQQSERHTECASDFDRK
jgi:hypothetical protein